MAFVSLAEDGLKRLLVEIDEAENEAVDGEVDEELLEEADKKLDE